MHSTIKSILKRHSQIIEGMGYEVDISYDPETDSFKYKYELSFKDALEHEQNFYASSDKSCKCSQSIRNQLDAYFKEFDKAKKVMK